MANKTELKPQKHRGVIGEHRRSGLLPNLTIVHNCLALTWTINWLRTAEGSGEKVILQHTIKPYPPNCSSRAYASLLLSNIPLCA